MLASGGRRDNWARVASERHIGWVFMMELVFEDGELARTCRKKFSRLENLYKAPSELLQMFLVFSPFLVVKNYSDAVI